jgi:hypothetical protein
MRGGLPTFDTHLTRVADETCKAASYLTASLSFRHVPNLEDRWSEAPTQLAFLYLRQGTHMAFLVTLAALLEEKGKSGRVNLPSLLDRLNDQRTRTAISRRVGKAPSALYARTGALQRRFKDHIGPLIPRVKDVRDNVVAHFGATTDWPATRIGVLTLLLIRTVVLVDAVHELVTGAPTSIRCTLCTVRYQGTSLWSKGIDGDPDIGPGPSDPN